MTALNSTEHGPIHDEKKQERAKLLKLTSETSSDELSYHSNHEAPIEEQLLQGRVGPPQTFHSEIKAIWSMAWKVSLATFCRISLGTISTAFVGHLGSSELAGAALAGIWTNCVQVLIYGFAVSLCTLCGQAYGARNFELVGIWLQLAIISLVTLSIPVMFSFFYVDRILSFVTSDTVILGYADTFARWTTPTVLPQAIFCAIRQYLQAQEIVEPATVIAIISVGVSIACNYCLIYGLGPLPGLGLIGAALAQDIASIFQPVALYVYAWRIRKYHVKTWKGWTMDCLRRDRVRKFASLSAGIALNLALDEWVYNALSSIAAMLGPLDLASNSILFNIWGLMYGLFWGFCLPTQVRSANFLGANQPDKAKMSLKVGFVLCTSTSLVVIIIVLLFSHSIISFFTPDPDLESIILKTLPIFCLAVFNSGIHLVLASVVEAMSLAQILVGITGIGSWFVLLPSAYLLGIFSKLGLSGLWMGSCIGEGSKFLLMGLALYQVNWNAMAHRAVLQSEGKLNQDDMNEFVQEKASLLLTPTSITHTPMSTPLTPNQLIARRRESYQGFTLSDYDLPPQVARAYSYGTQQ